MAINRIYLSSTFQDLEKYRAAVAKSLRKANKYVVGMEDYAAADERPLDRCLADVDSADAYIGIFAYRYGFIPPAGNDEKRSITELEYRRAKDKKPCLIFLVHENVPWLNKFNDRWVGEGENGARIDGLKKDLSLNHSVDFFQSEENLAKLVMEAMMRLENTKPATPAAPAKTGPEKRQITRDLFVAHAAIDEAIVRALVSELLPDPGGLSSLLAPKALFAKTEDDFLNLDRDVQLSDVAVVAVSDGTLAKMDLEPGFVSQALDIMRSRTGSLIALCLASSAVGGAAKWNFDKAIDVSGYPAAGIGLIEDLKKTFGARTTVSNDPVIGVPLVIAAMNKTEAQDLWGGGEKIRDELSGKALKKLEELKQALGPDLASRYDQNRDDYRPPGSNFTLTEMSCEAIERLAKAKNPRLQGRAIKLQRYPFEALISGPPELRAVYREMADAGCILVVDELSLFHPGVMNALRQSPMVTSPHTAILTVSPFPAYSQQEAEILREELKAQFHGVFDRFASDYDPQCELNVGDECRLRRWLHQTLPETLKVLRTARAVQERLALFAQEVDSQNSPNIAGNLYSRGGGL